MKNLLPALFCLVSATSAFAENIDEHVLRSVDRYRVVATDGSLNCRREPHGGGAIVTVFSAGDTIYAWEADDYPRVAYDGNGNPWLVTGAECYVRADTRYISPLAPAPGTTPYDRNGEITRSYAEAVLDWRIVTDEDSDDRRGHGGPRGLNCRVNPDPEAPISSVQRMGDRVTIGEWALDNRGKVWVRTTGVRVPCWMRGTEERLALVE